MASNFQKLLFETTDDQFYVLMERYDLTRESLEEMYQKIRNWYIAQPHLPKNALDNRMIAMYLPACKYSVERTKEKIDCYFTSRSIFPELYSNRHPFDADILTALKCCEVMFLPKYTKNFHRPGILRFMDVDPNLYNPTLVFKCLMMMADVRNAYDVNDGDFYIWDLTHVKFAHVVRTTPTLMKKFLFIVQNSYTSKIKGIHVLNCPSVAKNTIMIIKSLLKKKIADNIHFHDNLEELHQHIDLEYLPKDYGGELPSCDTIFENWKNVLQSNEWVSWFQKAELEKTDESQRLKKSDDIVGDLLGIAGTFRQLNVD